MTDEKFIDIEGFRYFLPELNEGYTAHAPNVTNAARLLTEATTPEEIARAARVYRQVVKLTVHTAMGGLLTDLPGIQKP